MEHNIIERLERIEKKLDGKVSQRFLDINKVANLTRSNTKHPNALY